MENARIEKEWERIGGKSSVVFWGKTINQFLSFDGHKISFILNHCFPTFVICHREFHMSSVTATISKTYVDCVTRAGDWRDCLTDTCPLVHVREFSIVY